MQAMDSKLGDDPEGVPLVNFGPCAAAGEVGSEDQCAMSNGACAAPDSKSIPPDILEKREWVRATRLKFSRRPEFPITSGIINSEGYLNQEYFRPSRTLVSSSIEDIRTKWTDKERDLLIEGIEKYGIGNYRMISEEFLPKWGPNELRLKTMRLIGRQNLQEYKFWRGGAEEIAREYEWNKALGLKLDCWKSGVLVYDDDGKVADCIAERNIEVQRAISLELRNKRRRA